MRTPWQFKSYAGSYYYFTLLYLTCYAWCINNLLLNCNVLFWGNSYSLGSQSSPRSLIVFFSGQVWQGRHLGWTNCFLFCVPAIADCFWICICHLRHKVYYYQIYVINVVWSLMQHVVNISLMFMLLLTIKLVHSELKLQVTSSSIYVSYRCYTGLGSSLKCWPTYSFHVALGIIPYGPRRCYTTRYYGCDI